MGDVVDMRLQFAASSLAATYRTAVREYAGVPQCKAMRDFLSHYKAESLSALPHAQKAELSLHMRRIFDALQRHSAYILLQFSVSDESSLSVFDRAVYDASMKATVELEDHYP